jgi:hypothetical protein
MKTAIKTLLLVATILGFAAHATAALATISPSVGGYSYDDSTGYWTGTPGTTFTHSYTDSDTTGRYYAIGTNGGWLCRNFFDFSIPVLGGDLVAATLTLPIGVHWSDPGIEPHPYTVYGRGSSYAFNDIGSGTVYGYTSIYSSGTVTISLNADALSAIEAAQGGTLGVGGIGYEYPSISYYVYDYKPDSNQDASLILDVVPEPTTLIIWSLLGGLGITIGRRWRKTA